MKCPMIIKEASPRWLKMVRSGKLGEGSLKRLSEAGYKDRTIKPLGHGAFRVVDLVFTGGVGKSVRKIPLIDRKIAKDIPKIYKDQVGEHKIWNKVRSIMNKKGIPVSKMVKRKGGIGYYSYIKGNKISDKATRIKRKINVGNYPRMGGKAEQDRYRRRLISSNKLKMKIHAILNKNVINKNDFEAIRSKFPHIRDTVAQNTVGKTLIDFDITNSKVYPINLNMKKNIRRESYEAMKGVMKK